MGTGKIDDSREREREEKKESVTDREDSLKKMKSGVGMASLQSATGLLEN